MTIIVRYIMKKCLFNTLLMLFAFVMLFAVFQIIAQIPEVGHGDFTILSLFIYTIALMPNYLYLLMPLAVLIGVMVAMLTLVNHSEYAIIRTSGLSLKRVMFILLTYGIFAAGVTFIVGEVIAPQTSHFAQLYKIVKTRQSVSTQLHSGIWSKDGEHDFVNIKQVLPDNTILGVSIFAYDNDNNLTRFYQARGGAYDDVKKTWMLTDVTVSDYKGQNISVTHAPSQEWRTSIIPSYFNVLVQAPEDMSALALIKYINHLEDNHQAVRRYQIAFWNKLLYPIVCISMALLALAFTPNNRRNINLGTKLFLGILIGIAFFFCSKMINFFAVLYSWNPIVSSLAPTVIVFFLGWIFVLRKE